MMTNHNTPDWQLLMSQWVEQKKGNTGITFPFLAGALALKNGERTVTAEALKDLISTIISHPIAGHFVGVRRCGNIQAPVLSYLPLNNELVRKCEIHSPIGQVALAFSPDAMSPFGGLDCDGEAGCIDKLIEYAAPHTELGNFSRIYNEQSKSFTYAPFLQDEAKFIKSVLGF